MSIASYEAGNLFRDLGISTTSNWTGMYTELHIRNSIWITLANFGKTCEAVTIWSYGNVNEDPDGISYLTNLNMPYYAAYCPPVVVPPKPSGSSNNSSPSRS